MLFSMMFVLLLLLFSTTSTLLLAQAGVLPQDFSLRFHDTGADLVWSPKQFVVRISASRPEFRFNHGKGLLGYPHEDVKEGILVLPLKRSDQSLVTTHGPDLEVWIAGKRVDQAAPSSSRMTGGFSTKHNHYNNISATPTVNINPARNGKYTTKRLSYRMRGGLQYPLFPNPVEVVAEVHYPVLRFPRRRRSPLVLFLHGVHDTCYDPNKEIICSFTWPCEPGCLSIPSHKGYRYVTNILASNGFITISIAANGIIAQEFFKTKDSGAEVRSLLIRHHLNLWAQWNEFGTDPWRGLFHGKVDLNRVVLVGHSRGGEGVHRAAIDIEKTDPYKIVGLVSYGPTAFGAQVTPDIHSVTILPRKAGL
jgi:hypothetical protein